MAGQPLERGTLYSPDAAGRKRIGESYLSSLLETAPVHKDRPSAFAAVELFLIVNAGVKIPDSLIKDMKLESIKWIPANPSEDTLPLLVLGKRPSQKEAFINNHLDDAAATLEIARQIKIRNGKGEFFPSLIRIAGVIQNRVVAVTYDLTEGNRLTELNVSMPYSECPPYLNDDWDTSWNLRSQLVTSLPTYKKRPYKTAAFITPEMQKAVREKDNMIRSPHDNALMVRFNERRAYFGKSLNVSEAFNLTTLTDNLGYYAKTANGNAVVGLTAEAARKRGIGPWEIYVPAVLQKA
ncbi:MAG: hypothetical protein Q7R31_00265 [Candidatus Levybacteria bacterium]|nr:hypothetical protein [Candidatus Levybacteria bacterium]